MMRHVVVAHDPDQWCAVPANNGANGPAWQWGAELLVGYTQGAARFDVAGHQTDNARPHLSRLARSLDGGETWRSEAPHPYQGAEGHRAADALPPPDDVDFADPGLVLRIEGHGYHGNAGQQWFVSQDRGQAWRGPYTFGALLAHPELAGQQFTGRTAYLPRGARGSDLFLSVRAARLGAGQISPTDKPFLARTEDGGGSFAFVAWIVPPSDPSRAVMPAPVRLSPTQVVAAIRRRNETYASCWLDCYASDDDGATWAYRSRIGETGAHNGNPPALIALADGRLCCAYGNRDRQVILARFSGDAGRTWGPALLVREGFRSLNGYPDLGYPRLFQRPDGRLVTAYFWCSPERPQTHIAATLFDAP
jgi:hypothetical protein